VHHEWGFWVVLLFVGYVEIIRLGSLSSWWTNDHNLTGVMGNRRIALHKFLFNLSPPQGVHETPKLGTTMDSVKASPVFKQ
jgi:hypothetical protein